MTIGYLICLSLFLAGGAEASRDRRYENKLGPLIADTCTPTELETAFRSIVRQNHYESRFVSVGILHSTWYKSPPEFHPLVKRAANNLGCDFWTRLFSQAPQLKANPTLQAIITQQCQALKAIEGRVRKMVPEEFLVDSIRLIEDKRHVGKKAWLSQVLRPIVFTRTGELMSEGEPAKPKEQSQAAVQVPSSGDMDTALSSESLTSYVSLVLPTTTASEASASSDGDFEDDLESGDYSSSEETPLGSDHGSRLEYDDIDMVVEESNADNTPGAEGLAGEEQEQSEPEPGAEHEDFVDERGAFMDETKDFTDESENDAVIAELAEETDTVLKRSQS